MDAGAGSMTILEFDNKLFFVTAEEALIMRNKLTQFCCTTQQHNSFLLIIPVSVPKFVKYKMCF